MTCQAIWSDRRQSKATSAARSQPRGGHNPRERMAIAETTTDRANPVDLVEEIATRNDWAGERTGADELTLVVSGQWCDYHVSLNWRGDLETLHIACAFDAKVPDNRLRRGLPARRPDQRAAVARPLRRVDARRAHHVPPGPDAERGARHPAASARRCSRPRSRPASATTRPSSSWSGPARTAARRSPPPCSRPRAGPDSSSRRRSGGDLRDDEAGTVHFRRRPNPAPCPTKCASVWALACAGMTKVGFRPSRAACATRRS